MRAIVAYLTAKPGKEAEFKEKMIAQAKRCLANEPGCLQFDVTQDPKEPVRFVMIEVYQDAAAIKAHQESAHFKEFRPVVSELLADRRIEIFDIVSDGKAKR
jgi:(4S)-4-hydroxy-5-phosphonooxypentane-2,3-dione isomerase